MTVTPAATHAPVTLVDARALALPVPLATLQETHICSQAGDSATFTLTDLRERPLKDLRISVTDRCNFRCSYCMPKSSFGRDHHFLPHNQLLSFEEIQRLAQIFMPLGVTKLRLTGGEPLLRKHLENLIEQLASLQTHEGNTPEITMTTNATLLAAKAAVLKAAGLNRVTVSLDAIEDGIFRQLNSMDVSAATVLKGIDAALAAGLTPLKVNMVVRKGINDTQIIPMIEHFRGSGVILRFIEYMDVGETNGWRIDEVLPSSEVLSRIQTQYPLHPLQPHSPAETAQRWALDDGSLEIGVIASVTQPFCHDCSRARLSMEGRLFMCLFASAGYDLRALLRNHIDDRRIAASIARLWQRRNDHYSELRSQGIHMERRVEMSYIGG